MSLVTWASSKAIVSRNKLQQKLLIVFKEEGSGRVLHQISCTSLDCV